MPKLKAIKEIELWCAINQGCFTPEQILEVVNEEFELPDGAIRVPSKAPHLLDARLCFSWFSRRITDATVEGLGELINRNHVRIIRQNQRAVDLLAAGDEKLTNHIINIYEKLNVLDERL